MPKMLKYYKDEEKMKKKRYKDRIENYEKGRFGKKVKYNIFERMLVKLHIFPDRWLAKMLGSSTNGIQTMRWRLKNNYLNLY